MGRMRLDRRQVGFLVRFAILLVVFFAAIEPPAVDRHVVLPLTRALTRLSGGVLTLVGEPVTTEGTMIRGSSFAVDIKNGCNGVEAMLLLCAAMLAFSAPMRVRLLGILGGSAALLAINVVRIVTLYLVGVHRRALFDTFHLAVWQTVMFAAAASIFAFWSGRVAPRNAAAPH
jgi:exosortase H (IPTLxxWG-CTERM-specific)